MSRPSLVDLGPRLSNLSDLMIGQINYRYIKIITFGTKSSTNLLY